MRTAPGTDLIEVRIKGEQLITRRDIDRIAVKSDAAQPSVGPAPLPVDINCIPVNNLIDRLLVQIDHVHAAMAFTL